jgi:hypothetical protein
MGKFQKPHIDRPGILDPKPGDPEGYVTNDGMWAAIPIIGCKAFAIIHNGATILQQSPTFLRKSKSPKRSLLNSTTGNKT